MTDAINIFHNSDYRNLTAIGQVFWISGKKVHPRLDGRASKSLQLPSNETLSLE